MSDKVTMSATAVSFIVQNSQNFVHEVVKILTSARPPDPNSSCARILMEFKGTVTAL